MPDKVLVDTSAWIDFFRKTEHGLHQMVASLLRENRAAGTGLIILELLLGAKTNKELQVVSTLIDTIHMVHESHSTHIEAGKMGHALAQKGKTMAVVDLMIAELAIENNLPLFTFDRRFTTIAESFPLHLLALP